MKISARNRPKGTIVEVHRGATTAHVRIDVAGTIVASSITNEAVDELKLAKGMTAYAAIKAASDVMVAAIDAMRALLILGAVLAAQPALAADPSGCDKFAWPIAAEQALLAKAMPAENGAQFDRDAGTGVALKLVDLAQAALPTPPERTSKRTPNFAGFARFGAGTAGLFTVSLSQGAWLDLVQDGHYLKPKRFSGATDCPNIRRTMRFDLGAEPFTLQVSGVSNDTIALVVTRGR